MDMLLVVLSLFLILGYAGAQSPQQTVLRIDDSNVCTSQNPSGIQYSTGWIGYSSNDARGRYLNTLTTTRTPYASAALFFKGNSIEYFADKYWDHWPNYAYVSIDGRRPDLVQSWDINAWQQRLWSISDLDDGDHQIIISRDGSTGVSSADITLDYFDITFHGDTRPSVLGPGATNAPSNFLIDDGHDRIAYEGSWSAMQPNTQQSFYYGGLQHTTTTPGSSLTFSFNGTAVYYFSDKRAQNGWALISVDGGEGELASTFLEPWDDRWFSQVLCWSKTGLSDGPHTVEITHSDQEGKYVSLDFFKYDPGPGSGATQATKKTPLPAIIGSSVGGGIALLLAAIICYMIHRKRSQSKVSEDREPEAGQQENAGPRPQLDHPGSHPVSYYGEKWSPEGQSNSPKPMSGLNERSAVQSYAGLPEV